MYVQPCFNRSRLAKLSRSTGDHTYMYFNLLNERGHTCRRIPIGLVGHRPRELKSTQDICATLYALHLLDSKVCIKKIRHRTYAWVICRLNIYRRGNTSSAKNSRLSIVGRSQTGIRRHSLTVVGCLRLSAAIHAVGIIE